jgi:hypothetical protein
MSNTASKLITAFVLSNQYRTWGYYGLCRNVATATRTARAKQEQAALAQGYILIPAGQLFDVLFETATKA